MSAHGTGVADSIDVLSATALICLAEIGRNGKINNRVNRPGISCGAHHSDSCSGPYVGVTDGGMADPCAPCRLLSCSLSHLVKVPITGSGEVATEAAANRGKAMFINDEAQKQVLPILVRTTANPTSSDVQQRAGALLQMNPGQQVKAEIIANLANNLYLARVAGQLYRLEIPLNVQPGETMDMTFLSAEPRITFQLLPQAQGGTSVQLSSVGKWLATVANDVVPLPANLEPLLDSPPQQPVLLANRLKEALTRCGLFYESHLAQWAAGNLQLEEILKEPQGKLSQLAAETKGAGGQGEPLDAGYADSRMLPLIKEQLLLAHNRVFSWQGEAWPGQGLEISIRERDCEEETGIEASLALQLPTLGAVAATLNFGKGGLSLQLVCDRVGSPSFLKEESGELRVALASAGISLARLAAKDDQEDA